jgi:hypothetical protein
MVALTPLQRKAAFAAAVELNETNKGAAAGSLGVSWTHLLLCMEGSRIPSAELAQRVADYCGVAAEQFWGPRATLAATA